MKLNTITLALSLLGLTTAVQAQKSTPLFDGKTLNGWKPIVGSAPYAIENGMIVGTMAKGSPNSFLVTEKEYGNFILELDVKLEGTETNSGIQTRSHFNPAGNQGKGMVYGRQVEIDPSARAWTGGIYDEARRQWLYPLELNPKAKSAYKVEEFNHYKIECIGNETKTWVNGIPVAYVIDTVDKTGFIGLQVHGIGNNLKLDGKKVYFKNIRIQTENLKPEAFPKGIYTVNFTPNSLSAYEKANGYKLLFDGKTNAGWVGAYKTAFPAKGWSIANGELTVLPSDGAESTNGGDIVTKEEFSAFDLSFDFKLSEGANSGVKYFVTLSEKNTGSAIGLEYQVLDDEKHPDAKLGRDGNRTLASLYDLITAKKEARFLHPIGAWNSGRVVVYPNNKVEHYLNGVKVLEYTRGSEEFRKLVALSKYKVWKDFGEAPKGHLLLQDHGNRVSFRSVKIKTL
ncbi:3-keto-disaccharide hydrolase [Pedobacter albus]